jgi:hypothetical protein
MMELKYKYLNAITTMEKLNHPCVVAKIWLVPLNNSK